MESNRPLSLHIESSRLSILPPWSIDPIPTGHPHPLARASRPARGDYCCRRCGRPAGRILDDYCDPPTQLADW